LAVTVKKPAAALPLFKIALEANPSQWQFWLSYFEALVNEKQFDNAKDLIIQGKKLGMAEEKVDVLEIRLTKNLEAQTLELPSSKKSSFTQQLKKATEKKEIEIIRRQIKPVYVDYQVFPRWR
jgi:hypothetical protein